MRRKQDVPKRVWTSQKRFTVLTVVGSVDIDAAVFKGWLVSLGEVKGWFLAT